MQLNWLNFVIGERLAKDAFDKVGVDGADKARRLGLIAAAWPSGDGGGASVMPIILAKSLAEKQAQEAAASSTASLTAAPASTTPASGGGGTQDGGSAAGQAVTRAEFEALKTTVTTVDGLFPNYPDVRNAATKDVARQTLEALGFTVNVTGRGTTIRSQSPDPVRHKRLAAGSFVILDTDTVAVHAPGPAAGTL